MDTIDTRDSDIIPMFMETLDPQSRFNMAMAVKIDELSRAGGEEDGNGITDEILDAMAREISDLRNEVSGLHHEMKILRGAMEETIGQLRELQRAPRPAEENLPFDKEKAAAAVRAAQEAATEVDRKARAGTTPAGQRSRAKKFRGVYCRHCATKLTGKHQTVFCSRKCGAQWRAQHPGEVATPRLAVNENGFDATLEAGVGVKAGSVSA